MSRKKGSIPWNKGKGTLTLDIKAYRKQYRIANREKIREQGKQYDQEHPERQIKYRLKNKEKIREKKRQRYQENKEAMKNTQKVWYGNNSEYAKERRKQNYRVNEEIEKEKRMIYYYANHEEELNRAKNYRKTPAGKIAMNRCTHKRRRELGFEPLNTPFEGSHGHHLDKTNVIYIPKELNISIPHDVHTGKNMNIINLRAWDYMEASVL